MRFGISASVRGIEEPRRRARIAIERGRALLGANRHPEAIEAFRQGRDVLDDSDVDSRSRSERT